jgi:hypothetical protein
LLPLRHHVRTVAQRVGQRELRRCSGAIVGESRFERGLPDNV